MASAAVARTLDGKAVSAGSDSAHLTLVRQTFRERQDSTGSAIARVRAIATDPHIHRIADVVTELHDQAPSTAGRPRSHPDWTLVLFGVCIRVFGSASATARALAEPVLWREVLSSAAHLVSDPENLPRRAPSRDNWNYFLKSRLSEAVLEKLITEQRDLAIDRAEEVGLLQASAPHPVGAYHRDHVVGIDGKVFSSPLRTLDTERVDHGTGEIRPIRQDTARERYGEGGVEGVVWGTKFAVASVRSPMANHRVVLGLQHFSSMTGGGEGKVFVDLATDLARRSAGVHAFTTDGAWRGKHVAQVQAETGCAVITPPRHLTSTRGGITIGRRSYATSAFPWSVRRKAREANCGGHQLWASAGTIFEQVIQSDGTSEYVELDRHQTKREVRTRKDGSVYHQFYARYSLECSINGKPHSWWEPLLPVADDKAAKFNRSEYLRVVPTTSEAHQRLYGMRQDTESLNAQLERAFYGQRLPAWGVRNQTAVVLLAAFAENSWARSTWAALTREER